jgi:hypothetical protein
MNIYRSLNLSVLMTLSVAITPSTLSSQQAMINVHYKHLNGSDVNSATCLMYRIGTLARS